MSAANRYMLVGLTLLSWAARAEAGLVARYAFEGDARDSSENMLHARFVGTAAAIADDDRGLILALDGRRGHVDCGSAAAFNLTEEITVAAWVRIDTIPGPWAAVVAKGDSAWRLSTLGTENRFHFAVTGAPSWHAADGSTAVPADEWHHVCGTFNGKRICLYVDGNLDRVTPYTGPISLNRFSVAIGYNVEMRGRRWHGRIDEVRIYDQALSATEVAALAAVESDQGQWGRLANPGHRGQRIKATLFFPGHAKDGTRPYECDAPVNTFLYTVHPVDARHLEWSGNATNRTFAVDQMVDVGFNVAVMSSWGEDFLPCSTGWAPWAPMQCSPTAHDELFTAALNKPILIIPFIESRADWAFRDEFPTFDGRIAPGTVSQIVNLIQRYLQNPEHPEWARSWARVYNVAGEARYAVALIHAASNRLYFYEHSAFAEGFDAMAAEVRNRTGVRVGFLLDALPPGTFAPGRLRPDWRLTGLHLARQESILGIMCFIPEVWLGSSDDAAVILWKRTFSEGWESTGIPFLLDVSPGYDAHLVFPASVRYGLNGGWTSALTELLCDCGSDGFVYNSWNGYTEAMAAMELREYGDTYRRWAESLTGMYSADGCVATSAH